MDGVPDLAGPSAQLGAEETYQPVCFDHYVEKHGREGVTDLLEGLGVS